MPLEKHVICKKNEQIMIMLEQRLGVLKLILILLIGHVTFLCHRYPFKRSPLTLPGLTMSCEGNLTAIWYKILSLVIKAQEGN